MPVYSYRCSNCGNEFDQQQSFTDKPLTRCPECNKKTLKKVISSVGVVFKGSGFYINDHKSSSGTSTLASSKSKKEAKETVETKETKSESSETKEAKPSKEKTKKSESAD